MFAEDGYRVHAGAVQLSFESLEEQAGDGLAAQWPELAQRQLVVAARAKSVDLADQADDGCAQRLRITAVLPGQGVKAHHQRPLHGRA